MQYKVVISQSKVLDNLGHFTDLNFLQLHDEKGTFSHYDKDSKTSWMEEKLCSLMNTQ